jgi:hypothetical protein
MDSIKLSIYQYEQQQKEQQKIPRYGCIDSSMMVQESLLASINSLSNNIVKAFEDQKKDYEAKIAELRTEFKEILTVLTMKKPVSQEIAELQTRIMELYAEEGKN